MIRDLFCPQSCYTPVALMRDGGTLCRACFTKNARRIRTETCRDKADPSWMLADVFIHWEGPDLCCDHCNEFIPSEYGDPDNEI